MPQWNLHGKHRRRNENRSLEKKIKNGETGSLDNREDDKCETMNTLVIHLYRDKMHPARANKTRSWIHVGHNIRIDPRRPWTFKTELLLFIHTVVYTQFTCFIGDFKLWVIGVSKQTREEDLLVCVTTRVLFVRCRRYGIRATVPSIYTRNLVAVFDFGNGHVYRSWTSSYKLSLLQDPEWNKNRWFVRIEKQTQHLQVCSRRLPTYVQHHSVRGKFEAAQTRRG